MKLINLAVVLLCFFLSCNNANEEATGKGPNKTGAIPQETATASFFPVTDFLAGQIADIKKQGINPLKIIHSKKREDSTWLKVEDLDTELAAFFTPVIDSVSLAGMFTERKFLDQTIGAFTFTYDPVKPLPDSFSLQRWDVYVDPNTNTVKRIYLLKKMPGQKTQQLTWLTGRYCRIVNISKDQKGIDFVEKDVTIKWDF